MTCSEEHKHSGASRNERRCIVLDLLIKNGKYPDFEKNELVRGNIGIINGTITYIGTGIPAAEKMIDAEGKVVSPGFIDIHMHEDDLSEGDFVIGRLMLKMGVTTACGGNCGIQHQRLDKFKSYIQKEGSPINWVMLVGYNSFRQMLGLGHEEEAGDDLKKRIRELIEEELSDGASGISFGIEYDPGIRYEDMIDVLSLLQGKPYLASAHFRLSGNGAIESIKEMGALSEDTGVKFQISHLCSCSATGQMRDSLKLIEKLIKKNPLLDFDTYPYNAFSTLIGSAVFEEESMKQWGGSPEDIMLTKEPYKNVYCTEKIIKEVRRMYPEMMAVGFTMNEEEVAAAVAAAYGMIGSDGTLYRGEGHPRAAGTFPRVLGKYVREEKKLSLIDALKKMTIKPADRLNLFRKGRIEEGADADLTILDPEIIIDGADYTDINIPPKGICYVILDGRIAVEDNTIIDEKIGRFIPFKG